MGFDMEVCLEVLEGGEWRQVGELLTEEELAVEYGPPILQKRRRPFIWRNYAFFQPFGFRAWSDEEVIDQPRGLPSDVTTDTATDWEEWGNQSVTTWFSFDELNSFLSDRPEQAARARTSNFIDVMQTMANYLDSPRVEDVRAVIWFSA